MASFASMLLVEAKAAIYARGLSIATGLGLVVESWIAGDPTRSLYHFVSEVLSVLEVNVAGFMSSGFLDFAKGDWLTLLAKQGFNVDRIEATFASAPVTLTNAGGGLYEFGVGDVTVKSISGQTFRNIVAGTLLPVGSAPISSTIAATITLDFVADEAGADSSAGIGELIELVTTFLGVTCSNTTLAAVGLDEEEDEDLRVRCRDKLSTLSAAGPRDIYNAVVRDPKLTGVTDITKSRTNGDSTTGDIDIYVAGAAGPVAGASVTAAQGAVEKWAAPVCMKPHVHNCSAVTVAITYEVWLYDTVGEETATITDKIVTDLTAMFAVRPIGGDVIPPATTGKLYQSLIEGTIKASYPGHTFRVAVTLPAADVSLAINEVAVIGTVTPDVHQVPTS